MRQSNNQSLDALGRLECSMENKRPLVYLELVCSAVTHVVVPIPFIFIWLILRELLGGSVDSGAITRWAWLVVRAGSPHIPLYGLALMLAHVAAFRVERTLRGGAMRRMLEMPLGPFDQQNLGKLGNIIDGSVGLTHAFRAHQLSDPVGTLVCFVTFCVVMFVLERHTALLCLISVLIQLLATGLMITNKTYRESIGAYMDHQQGVNSEAVEHVRGMPMMKAFQQLIYSSNAFHQTLLDHIKWARVYARSYRRMSSIYTVASFGYAFISVPLAYYLLNRGEDMVGAVSSLVFFILVTPFISEYTIWLMYVVSDKREAVQVLDRLDTLCDASTEAKGSTPLSLSSHTIQLEGVSFRYSSEVSLAVSDAALTIPEGACVALVGVSGNSKTTLARLVARFWDAETGRTTIGREDISQIAAEEVLRHISLAFQNGRLFKKSIRDSVAYGSTEVTGEEIYAALDKTHYLELVRSLPYGLDTVIGSKGVYLSGGGQRRIASARAFLEDAPILFLDETTSFVDPESEHVIRESLYCLIAHKTVLVVTHRPSSIVNADLIVVMQQGRIVE